MIPEEHRDDIIRSGLDFLHSLTVAYGTEEGMKLWTAINSNLDSDISGKILFTMLTGGEYSNTVTVSKMDPNTDKVQLVKSIRNYTGIGLKEAIAYATDILDSKSVTFKIPAKDKQNFKTAMTTLGCRAR